MFNNIMPCISYCTIIGELIMSSEQGTEWCPKHIWEKWKWARMNQDLTGTSPSLSEEIVGFE